MACGERECSGTAAEPNRKCANLRMCVALLRHTCPDVFSAAGLSISPAAVESNFPL